MADEADHAADYQRRLIEHGINNRPAHRAGPADCQSCGKHNDRAQAGYATCTACFDELVKRWEETAEEFSECVMEGEGPEGEAAEMTLAEYAGHIRNNGYWGFVSAAAQEMHLWAEEGTPPDDLLYLVGHEIGHTLGQPLDDPRAEEDRADTYGAAAALAWQIVSGRKSGDYVPRAREAGDSIILAD